MATHQAILKKDDGSEQQHSREFLLLCLSGKLNLSTRKFASEVQLPYRVGRPIVIVPTDHKAQFDPIHLFPK